MIGRVVLKKGASLPFSLAEGVGNLATKRESETRPADYFTWSDDRRMAYIAAQRVSPERKAEQRAARWHGIEFRADGTFRAVDVVPGTYVLMLSKPI